MRLQRFGLFVALFLATNPSIRAIELVGVNVTPHQFSENLKWRRPPDPELSARVEFFIHNPTEHTQRVDAPFRVDGRSPEEWIRDRAWAWHDPTPSTGFELPPSGLRVVRWNGMSAAWGVDTQHVASFGDNASAIAIPLQLDAPKLQIESILFVKSDRSPYPNRMLATVRNHSPTEYRLRSCRLWLPKSNDTVETLYPESERTVLNPYPATGSIAPGEMVGIELEYDSLPLTYCAVEVQVVSTKDNTAESLWSYLKIRPAAFDISGGWIADVQAGKQNLLKDPYIKALAWMHINTGQIEEVPGYSDDPEAFAKLPLKRFNRMADRNRYDNDSMLSTIHAVEFLGEPQYGGGRPVPPQEVFDQLASYRSWKLPTSITLSEERTWRYYSGLSDYPHYDAYRVIAPAADAWSAYDRWDGKSLRWGAPLETIGDMTRSLRQQSRPVSIAYWSQGAHHDWGGFLSPRRGSPTPDELRSQAWHGLGNGIASLYWFNLSLKSLAKFPDLMEPMARVGREIHLLRPQLELGTSYEYHRIASDGKPSWDVSSIATRDALLMVANDLAYGIDEKTRTFAFDRRDGEFPFRIPLWMDQEIHCFRVDADGAHDVDFVIDRDQRSLKIRDTVHVVGIYLATTDPEARRRIDALHQRLIEADRNRGFDPVHDADDLKELQALAD
jgi:hypothetical protein